MATLVWGAMPLGAIIGGLETWTIEALTKVMNPSIVAGWTHSIP